MCDPPVPVTIPQAFELHGEHAHEGGPQSTARDQVFSHQGREQVNVERGAIEPVIQRNI